MVIDWLAERWWKGGRRVCARLLLPLILRGANLKEFLLPLLDFVGYSLRFISEEQVHEISVAGTGLRLAKALTARGTHKIALYYEKNGHKLVTDLVHGAKQVNMLMRNSCSPAPFSSCKTRRLPMGAHSTAWRCKVGVVW